jgi:rare lipoprotein A
MRSISPLILAYLKDYEQSQTSHNQKILIVLVAILCLLLCLPALAEPLKASWYSIESLKKEGTYKKSKGVMADGNLFSDTAFTCACNLYPLHTLLRVTCLANNKSVVVRVTDRISRRFTKTRVDLSKVAFQSIADLKKGLVEIKVEEIQGLIN